MGGIQHLFDQDQTNDLDGNVKRATLGQPHRIIEATAPIGALFVPDIGCKKDLMILLPLILNLRLRQMVGTRQHSQQGPARLLGGYVNSAINGIQILITVPEVMAARFVQGVKCNQASMILLLLIQR
jgi:hypothetical protein